MDYRFHPGVQRCVTALNAGGVIAYPTEAVWGLGCDPFNQHAVNRVLALKQRQPEKGLILVAANMAQIDWLLTGLTEGQMAQLRATWPGHITWLIPHQQRIPRNVCGVHDTIAIRVSRHPVVKALCERFGGPLVSTSANPQTLPPARNAVDVRRYFGERDIVIAPGATGREAAPSVIRDLATGKILRA